MTNLPVNIQDQFKEKLSDQVRLEPEGLDRYRIFTPFGFDDGDRFSIVLKKDGDSFHFSDEGHTLMHLTYEMDWGQITTGTRQKIIDSTLTGYDILNDDGELKVRVPENRYGDSLFSFLQGLIKISDISYLNRERVKSTFMEDFRSFIRETVDPKRFTFQYVNEKHDPNGKYPVDCRINGVKTPLFMFAIQNDDQCRDATINLHQYESWGMDFYPMAIFQDQENINRRVLARFSDVSEKQFSGLYGKEDKIQDFIQKYIERAS